MNAARLESSHEVLEHSSDGPIVRVDFTGVHDSTHGSQMDAYIRGVVADTRAAGIVVDLLDYEYEFGNDVFALFLAGYDRASKRPLCVVAQGITRASLAGLLQASNVPGFEGALVTSTDEALQTVKAKLAAARRARGGWRLMATPSRMVQIQCRTCGAKQWIVDCDYRRPGGPPTDYEHEVHECRPCGTYRGSWKVLQKGPPGLVLSQEQLAALGPDWSPPARPPEPPPPPPPLFVMRDQGSSLSYAPTVSEAREWLGFTRPGEFLRLDHRDGGSLRVDLVAPSRHTLTCVDANGATLARSEGHDLESTLSALERYLAGDVEGAVAHMRGRT